MGSAGVAAAARPAGADLLDLLLARRSVGRVLPDRPPREVIEKLLQAACAAPNHHLSQPWRFVVIAGDERVRLGQALRQALAARLPETESAASQALLAKEATKLLRAPVVIVVAVRAPANPRLVLAEELASGACAAHNILLAAQALGLGAMWRTGDTAYDPAVRPILGLSAEDTIVGFIYVGYPDPAQPPPPAAPRLPYTQVTRWLGWNE